MSGNDQEIVAAFLCPAFQSYSRGHYVVNKKLNTKLNAIANSMKTG